MLTERELYEIRIDRPDEAIYSQAKDNWDHISKPIDGLGDFETLVCRIAGIQRKVIPDVKKRALVVLCSDNGIVDEGISQSDRSITEAVAKALGSGISSACTLGKSAGVDVIPVDMGIAADATPEGVINMKVAAGTRNFLKEPAMSREQLLTAIENGIGLVKRLASEGHTILATGEMGIGNTTTSTAVLSALLGIDSVTITGRGAGLDDDRLKRKKEVIVEAKQKYDFDVFEDERDITLEVCRTLGGFDIAGLMGLFIGGAINHIPIVIDGFISATAAVAAKKLIPGVEDYMLASHCGRESGLERALSFLGLFPYINGNMALGEGTGALMLFPLLDMVLEYYKNGAKFDDYKIEEYRRLY